MDAIITQLYCYPVKSLAGIRMPSAQLTPKGFAGDREWMVIDERGRFVSQRQLPGLASIQPALDDAAMLMLTHSSGTSLPVASLTKEAIAVKVWSDHCRAFVADMQINDWLTQTTQSKCPLRLVKFDQTSPRHLPLERFGPSQTLFADAAPYLIASEASLESINGHLLGIGKKALDIRRFRPNIVIAGIPPFEEHLAGGLQTATTVFELVDPCQRCSVITVNPDIGERDFDGKLLTDIAVVNAMPGNSRAPAFGVNSILSTGADQWLTAGEPCRLG